MQQYEDLRTLTNVRSNVKASNRDLLEIQSRKTLVNEPNYGSAVAKYNTKKSRTEAVSST